MMLAALTTIFLIPLKQTFSKLITDTDDVMYIQAVLHIRKVDPGSWSSFLAIQDPGSGISDPGLKNNKRE
jgi:hypothetical protein